MNRDQLAYHLFKVMNQDRVWVTSAESAWEMMIHHDWHKGYLRLTNEVVRKKYKP